MPTIDEAFGPRPPLTTEAACKMVEKIGGEVAGIVVLIDLAFIPWRKKLGKYDILTLIQYDSE